MPKKAMIFLPGAKQWAAVTIHLFKSLYEIGGRMEVLDQYGMQSLAVVPFQTTIFKELKTHLSDNRVPPHLKAPCNWTRNGYSLVLSSPLITRGSTWNPWLGEIMRKIEATMRSNMSSASFTDCFKIKSTTKSNVNHLQAYFWLILVVGHEKSRRKLFKQIHFQGYHSVIRLWYVSIDFSVT